VVLCAFALGFVVSRVSTPEAHAQSNSFASTMYVPSDGLAFRAFDGRVVAKLSYDARGGVFELYDEHERPATTVRPEGQSLQSAGGTAVPAKPRFRPDLGF
jgi:hypothetical protein